MRNKIKQILLIAWTNSITWIRSPRIWYVILVTSVFCFGTFHELKIQLNNHQWTINPFESFLIVASNQTLLTGTLFLIFISEIPPKTGFHCYQWIRTTRSRWAYGCVLYCLCMVLFMIFLLTIISLINTLDVIQWTISWTDNTRLTEGIPDSLAIIPDYIRSRYSPVGSYFAFVLLTGNYWLMLALIVLFFSFLQRPQYGLSIVMILQLLPWIINTFVSYDTPHWFPIYFADINLLQYKTSGLDTFWCCVCIFMLINVTITIAIHFFIRKAPLLSDTVYK